jgi:hypothetical protein
MPALASDLRRQLENVCIAAREKAEEAARSALQKRAVEAAKPFPHFTAREKDLRNKLRARGQQAGDLRHDDKTQSIDQLTQELAYEYWHRMLFARFLAENHLLMHPDGVAVSLTECDELAPSADPPAANGFVLAARYASRMLPQVFRADDVLLEVEFAPEHRLALEKLLGELPPETFLADDSLGWVYQFWQTARKKQVNESGNKIDARTISAVTQLFTEDYMVQFLLHNTLWAWWCARHNLQGPPGGADLASGGRQPPGIPPMEYLRWRDDGTPAAGKFEGWPKTLKDFTLLDPCCGSGHFLVAAFNLLVPLRMHDEGLSALEACDAVLRENIFGLELDPRCTQIAAFALAVAAWKFPGDDGQPLGYRELPSLNIACTGIGPQASEAEWLKLAEQSGYPLNAVSREPIMNGLRNLHALFSNAPTLGSLIDPNQLSATVISADYETLLPYLSAALTGEQSDDDAHERAVAAAGMVKAAELLAREYILVVTNVPYLGRGKQDDALKQHLEEQYRNSKADLATAFIERCIKFCKSDGTAALVTPQNWLFLSTYGRLRESLLTQCSWNAVARLGPNAFRDMNWWAATTALLILTARELRAGHEMICVDVSRDKRQDAKALMLQGGLPSSMTIVAQVEQIKNPDARIRTEVATTNPLLEEYASNHQGLSTGDNPRFRREHWEVPEFGTVWAPEQSTVDIPVAFGGRSGIIKWENGAGELYTFGRENVASLHNVDRRGEDAWCHDGVAVTQMNRLCATRYTGEKFDTNAAVLLPRKPQHLAALWAFCESPDFPREVRNIDQKTNVTNGTLVKVPFDLAHWEGVAAERYPAGLPEPESDDPTQWLFHGRPESSTSPLQVSVARLLGYRWPAELDQKMRLSHRARDLICRCEELLPLADRDGLVPIPAVRGDSPAADRLLEMLQAAFGKANWSNSVLHDLLTKAGCKPGTTLDDWLRNAFFEQHCKLFHNRPFIWHVWDGRKDGFSCLVNYHRLNHKGLENLTYSYLQDWITAQAAEARAGKTGADLRLAAAQTLQDKLKLILAGEPPYDIFVRWKPLSEQAIGWHPDLNDGVRMNIRPFIEAGILRKNPNIKWTKDRGKEPHRDKTEFPWFWPNGQFTGDRVNDVHLTIAQKQAARNASTPNSKSLVTE